MERELPAAASSHFPATHEEDCNSPETRPHMSRTTPESQHFIPGTDLVSGSHREIHGCHTTCLHKRYLLERPVNMVEGKSLQNTQESKHTVTSWARAHVPQLSAFVIDAPDDSPAC